MKDIFCAFCQKVTPHKGYVDGNGEFVFECQNNNPEEIIAEDGTKKIVEVKCIRFVKFPADVTPENFAKLLDLHEQQNTGQIKAEDQEKKLKALIGE